MAPFIVRTDIGETIKLTAQSPAAVQLRAVQSVQRFHERALAHSLRDEGFTAPRASVDTARALYRRKNAPMSALQKAGLRNATCGAIWTKKRLFCAGYSLPSLDCDKCGAHEDSLFDRIWSCLDADVVYARNKWSTPELRRKARQATDEERIAF